MVQVTVKVEGLRELEKALRELPRATAKRVMVRALKEAAKPLIADASANAPVLTGALKDSINVSSRKPKGAKGPGSVAFAAAMAGGASRAQAGQAARAANAANRGGSVEVYVGPGRNPQAIFQEFGTSKHPPQPFMRPAWDSTKQQVVDSIKAALGDEIMKAARRLAKKNAIKP